MNITSYVTNQSSLMVQKNLTKSTNALNTAIERMTTGFKINGAKDNAANYSISQSMSSKISAYQVAEENAMMGLDMVQTANAGLEQMTYLTERLRNLAVQAQNGTYGQQSLDAMNAEAQSIITELDRIQANIEYNGQNLLSGANGNVVSYMNGLVCANASCDIGLTTNLQMPAPSGASGSSGSYSPSGSYDPSGASGASSGPSGLSEEAIMNGVNITTYSDGNKGFELHDGFIQPPSANSILAQPTTTSEDVINLDNETLAVSSYHGETFGIASADALLKIANLINSGQFNPEATLVLTNDIDLTGIDWTPIGTSYASPFKGTFDGQGHVIKGLTIDSDGQFNGLFGYVSGGSISNLGLVDCNIKGNRETGALAGDISDNTIINNCYSTGTVSGSESIGGLVGKIYHGGYVCNSYSTCAVTGYNTTGGLVGYAGDGLIVNSYATGSVSGGGDYTGGLVGYADNVINSCATGSVSGGGNFTGGLVGYANNDVINSYVTGSVSGGNTTGGLVGHAYNVINSYATGSVSGDDYTGGLEGHANNVINSYATGSVSGDDDTGGLVGDSYLIVNSYSAGSVTSTGTHVGAFAGSLYPGSSHSGGYNAEANTGLPEVGYQGMDLTNVTEFTLPKFSFECSLQIGINGDTSSQISFTSSAPKTSLDSIITNGIQADGTIELIDSYLNELTSTQTSLGAVENRLTSAIESIGVAYDNLVSSRSTLRDADIAKESSEYIKAQILQQAAATLLATANQSPSIALQLI